MRMSTLAGCQLSCILFITNLLLSAGDLNAHVSANNALFHYHLVQLCTDSGLVLSIMVLLPNDIIYFYL